MIMQIVRFQSSLPFEEVQKTAEARSAEFQNVPGLIQKYYFRAEEPGHYGGVYIWDSRQSLAAYRDSELAATIPQAYKVLGPPQVEVVEIAFTLRK